MCFTRFPSNTLTIQSISSVKRLQVVEKMKVKIVYGDDMRRWRYPESNRFTLLIEFIRETFKFPNDSSFFIQFEDDENDRVTITSETDFDDAFACAQQEKRKSLKIFVNEGSIDHSHSKV